MSSMMTGFPTWVSMSLYSSSGDHGSRLVHTSSSTSRWDHSSFKMPLPEIFPWHIQCNWIFYQELPVLPHLQVACSKRVCSAVILAANVNTQQYNGSDHDGDGRLAAQALHLTSPHPSTSASQPRQACLVYTGIMLVFKKKKCLAVMEWCGSIQAAVGQKGRPQQAYGNQDSLYSSRQFSAHTKCSLARTDNRAVQATRKTCFRYC